MKRFKQLILIFAPLLYLTFSCSTGIESDNKDNLDKFPWAYEGISELRRGDIIVRANSNFFPATSFVENGWNAGHAAIVIQGFESENTDSLLANTVIFESHSRPLPRNHQLREVKALDINNNPFLYNDSFVEKYKGSRYRLRLELSENQIDSIIDFIINQKGSYSSWNSIKRFPNSLEIIELVDSAYRENWADNTHWYCSLLIWQAVLYVTGIDLDDNAGYFVYPNDLIMSNYFDNNKSHKGRSRF
ncbi:MAG: hypothetical protein KGZ97_01155 [Bacteroidetes bacterium]|nr:hypothetical protein [Bacteroidota bacterium]